MSGPRNSTGSKVDQKDIAPSKVDQKGIPASSGDDDDPPELPQNKFISEMKIPPKSPPKDDA